MLITAVTLDLPHSAPPTGEGLPSDSAPDGFLLALQEASLDPAANDDAPPLHALALGNVEVITTQTPAPEASELKAFAAAQGLSPQAVAWLFDAPHTPGMVPGAQHPPSAQQPLAPASAPAMGEATAQAQPDATLALVAGLAMGMPPAWTAASPTAPTATSPLAEPNVLPASWPSTHLLLSAGGKAPAQPSAPVTAEPPVPEEVLDLLTLDPETQDLLKQLGLQDPEVPETKATPAGTSQSSLIAEQPRSPIDALTRPTLLAGQASAAPTAAQAENATPADRAAQIQALAQKIGEALGQRLMGHIERGQWQVRLLLRPASLGEVEVDLRLRAGELDATLRAMNPLTRELLTEGLPRLREGLTQAGMEVAQLHVGTGDASRNGGNPTPRSFARQPETSAPGAAEASQGTQPSELSAIRRQGANGWDVMV